jgi:RecJ-like exonuclease
MGSCIICGTATDGEVCDVHEEDVGFVFEGTSPDQLTPNRYYRGTVDGYADFGVFVDIGDSVTGLLHQSELDQRLESLSWEPGDEVFVQVTGVRDNGNVDLSWSIRQDEREFRGLLVDSPDGERRYEADADADETTSDATTTEASPSGGESSGNENVRQRQSDGGETPAPAREATSGGADGDDGDSSEETTSDATPVHDDTPGVDDGRDDDSLDDDTLDGATVGDEDDATVGDDDAAVDDTAGQAAEPEPAVVDDLSDADGDLVRLEGEITSIHQTGGPTIFELRDGSGTADCAAFDGAGVRAYPDVEVGDVVRLDGTVERRRGDLQIETESLEVLTEEAAEDVSQRVDEAMAEAVRPDAAQFVALDDPAEPLAEGIIAAATRIRQALAQDRPVVLRHPATADGYAAGAAIERGAFARARADAAGADPDYHVVHRRPLDDPLYGMDAATSDLTRMLQDRERHGEQLPLIVLVGVGSSAEALDAVELLDVYGVERVVLDTSRPDEGVESVGDPVVNPHVAEIETSLSNAALGAALGATVGGEADLVDELAHVPAIGYWEDIPGAYLAASEDAGYDESERNAIREALALEAHYQRYNDKRELVADLLFEGAPGLADHVAEQFREKLETEVATARDNLVVRETGGVRFAVLDTDAFTHRFDFPPTELLLDELHRREREESEGAAVTIGAGEDELLVRSTRPVDVHEIAVAADDAGIEAVGGADGHLEYLPGDRDAAIEAVVGALASSIDA